jgi:hypothetical protein
MNAGHIYDVRIASKWFENVATFKEVHIKHFDLLVSFASYHVLVCHSHFETGV